MKIRRSGNIPCVRIESPENHEKEYLNTALLFAAQVVQAETDTKIIVIPSDRGDDTYFEQQNSLNNDVPRMRDETYSEAVHRQMCFEEDMRLKGIDIGIEDD